MSAAPAAYDLCGGLLVAQAETEDLLGGLEAMIGARRLPGRDAGPDSAFRLEIGRGGLAKPPADGALLYKGDLPEAGPCAFLSAGERLHLALPDRASLDFDPAARRAAIRLAPGAGPRLPEILTTLALDLILDAQGCQMIHAAALSMPDLGMILLCAPSGTGKTTAALGLARAGLGFATDDAAALHLHAGEVRVWGLPRAVKIHRRTAAMLPWLEGVLGDSWDSAGEQAVAPAALEGRLTLEARSLPLAAILALRRAPGGETALTPLNRAELLALLAADNLRGSALGLTAAHARRYAMLAAAARQASAWDLALGAEPEATPSVVMRALRGMVRRA